MITWAQMKRLAAAIAGLLVLTSVLFAVQPPKTGQAQIKVEVDLVNVNFSATDSKGRMIAGLNATDFTVEEDGKVQNVVLFSRENELPLTLALLMDISPSVAPVFEEEKRTASAFLKSLLRRRDLALLLAMDRRVVLAQDFTEDVEYLTSAIQDLKISGAGTSLYDAVYLAAEEKLSKEAGRKAIVLMSDGDDTTSGYNASKAMIAVHKSNSALYAISNGDNSRTMRKMAEETGGAFFRIRQDSDFGKVFEQIAVELRTQYSVAYHSTNTARDGAFRRIKIIPKNSSIDIRARRGYYAPTASNDR
jgi:VWFA-related protein